MKTCANDPVGPSPRRRTALALLCCMLAAGCQSLQPPPPAAPQPAVVVVTLPPPEPPPPPPPEPLTEPPVDAGELLELLDYHQRLRTLNAAELAREAAAVASQPPGSLRSLRQGLVLGMARDPADLALAEQHLLSVETATDAQADLLRPLARMLIAQLGEQRRLNDGLLRLSQQLRDSQRRAEQLTQTLEALKAIEHDLPASGSGPRPVVPGAPNGGPRP